MEMIPKIFVKDGQIYPQYAAFGIAPVHSGLVPAEFADDQRAYSGNPTLEIVPNVNIESILQVHRRKMLRRAANRRSAQLSRARKKAHLEELKTENSKLQRLVDVLDSQPELVFCLTASGRLTYISERTINFIKVNFAGEDSDDDPTSVSQILAKESVETLLETIHQLQKFSTTPSGDSDLNMLFSVKEIYFHDAFGHPMIGNLRCSKVNHRSSLNDLQTSDTNEKAASNPPAKKARTSKNSSSGSETAQVLDSSNGGDSTNDNSWNLSNFNILADYASNFKEDIMGKDEGRSKATSSNSSNEKNTAPPEQEDEFVCVVRMNEGFFTQFNRANTNLLMFSSVLSAASMEAHDLEMNQGMSMNGRERKRGGSPSGSNNSGAQTSNSSNQIKNSTSSEAGSEDNNTGETDSN